jgi:5-methylcytosine-specific restriction protein B
VAEPPPRLDLLAIHADFSAALRESDLVFGADHDDLVRTFLASLAAKRFLILTGLAGSGKTQIALRFGEWMGGDRGLVIPVRPDWTGAEALFGYEDALQPIKKGMRAWNVPQALEFMLRAASDPRHPYLLILDEMNLAHVERYFADFLSGMETRQPCLPNLVRGNDGCWRLAPGKALRVPLPSNLFVVGTVNADETTYLFSPKVLDRANSIEFRVRTEDLQETYRRPRPCRAGEADLVRGFLAISADDEWHVQNPPAGTAVFSAGMKRVHRILAENNLEFAHRVFYEASRFAAMLSAAGDADPHRALDRQVMQKILPRIHGSRQRMEAPLCALASACLDAREAASVAEGRRFDPLGELPENLRLPLSYSKIRRMVRSLRTNQFTSFME